MHTKNKEFQDTYVKCDTKSVSIPNMTKNEHQGICFNEIIVPLHLKDFSPPADKIYVSDAMKVKRLFLTKAESGYFGDWHTPPFPLMVIVLQGTLEIELPSGEKKVVRKGEMLFEKDDFKLMHRTSAISKEEVYAVVVEF